MKMVTAENVCYAYWKTVEQADGTSAQKEVNALRGVSLSIEKGSFTAILGHNGSGKSTFAKQINALLIPTEGTIWVDGMCTSEEGLLWEIRKKAGMVFQNPDNQLVATVVEEDVAFGPENLGMPPADIRKTVEDSLLRVGMTEYAKAAPSHLSGGQKQRIAIAGILAMKPDCIVLDEPTAMLDPGGRKEVMETLHRLNKQEGITIVLITHYMEEAVQADQVFVMDDGKLVLSGMPKEVFSQVKRLKGYGLDVPQVTELADALRQEGVDLPADILTVEEMVGALCRLQSTI